MNIKLQMLLAGLILGGIVFGFFSLQDSGTKNKSAQDKAVKTDSKPTPAETKPTPPEAKANLPKAKSPIRWYSYDDGMAMGKDKKKKIFLNFYADWCGYCKQMEKKTFADTSVISYMNENFIPVRVNADKEMKIAAVYEVQGLPASFFIAENGESIGSQPGYIPPEMLLPLLKYIHTDSYKNMSFDKFAKD